MPLLVKMPKWGMLMKAGTVTAWMCAEGDTVAAGDPLFTGETDKASNDVEAAGVPSVHGGDRQGDQRRRGAGRRCAATDRGGHGERGRGGRTRGGDRDAG